MPSEPSVLELDDCGFVLFYAVGLGLVISLSRESPLSVLGNAGSEQFSVSVNHYG